MSLMDAIKKSRLEYQKRYYNHYTRYIENKEDKENHGAMLEASYVLINFFGLTSKEVEEIEYNGGFTNDEVDELYASSEEVN